MGTGQYANRQDVGPHLPGRTPLGNRGAALPSRFSLGVLPLVFLVLGVMAESARATLVTWECGGQITGVRDLGGALAGQIQVGDSWSITYVVDTAVEDSWADDPEFGVFKSSHMSMVFSAGLLLWTAQGEQCTITVRDGNDDRLSLAANGFTAGANRILEFGASFKDSTGTIFTSDALPSPPPAVSLFDSAVLDVGGYALSGSGPFSIRGDVVYLTPEPVSALMLVLGIGLAGRPPRLRRQR